MIIVTDGAGSTYCWEQGTCDLDTETDGFEA